MFTGIDGSGKSTAAEALFSYLTQEKGLKVFFQKYPNTETWSQVEHYYMTLIQQLSKKPRIAYVSQPVNTLYAIHTSFDADFTLTEFEKEGMYADFDYIINDRYYESNLAVFLLHMRRLARLYPHQFSLQTLRAQEIKIRQDFSFKHKTIDIAVHMKPDYSFKKYKDRMEKIDNVTKFDPLLEIDALYHYIPGVYEEVLTYLQNHKKVKKVLTFDFDKIKDNVDAVTKKVYKNLTN